MPLLEIKDPDGTDDAYRLYLITRAHPPAVSHSPSMLLKRIRVRARTLKKHIDRTTSRLVKAVDGLRSKGQALAENMRTLWIGKVSYDPGRYYMRGPGPKFREKRDRIQADLNLRTTRSLNSSQSSSASDQYSPGDAKLQR